MSSVQVTIPTLEVNKQLGTSTKLITCKTTPNMSLNELIAQIVKDHNLGSPSQYNLKYQNKWLDRTLIFRLANLPRLAKLELKKIEHFVKKNSEINIALQLKDGTRITKKVKISSFLWNILIQLQVENSNVNFLKLEENGLWLQPTLQLLNREISDLETLRTTTLDNLGIASGSVLIRLNYKKSELTLDRIDSLFIIEEEQSNQQEPTPKSVQSPDQANSSSQQNVLKDIPPQSITKATAPSESQTQIATEKPNAEQEETNYSNFKVFRPLPDGINISSRLQIPDEFYSLNSQEIKKLVISQQKALQKLVDGGPLKTNKMRQKELEAKMKKYPKTLIRLKLPNLYQVQFGLLTTDPISKLYEIVKSMLNETDRPFQLYTIPPLKNLNPDSNDSCFDEGLTPASIVHFKWISESEGEDKSSPIIRSELLALAEDIELPASPVPEVPETQTSKRDPAQLLSRLTNSSRDNHPPAQSYHEERDYDEEPSSSSQQAPKDPVKDKLKKFLRL
ncbi:hypothetical protein CONCODRAFT_56730 [Conidiobolus coronatus NRRL 28638]|uniref:UBX domain-containing protein n=1 Tax=Conidiobolus coronatus (strain ATCC 28846 / CBS 209.66 / NRRL 28638) TaxID=796925 RepID=A0A137PAZ5_CONC2|nr:hypothetical protein CONCODRAFT_56730 [Conidiobolus coronatus NRRL 28638]|eukprot:KXN72101.1 hypothetical protein CONCODRAFT_56730 [Conidiobolus coronatus NRRL 28638]